MTTTVGYAALDIIPSLRNMRSEIERQSAAPMAQAGKTAGNRFGTAAGNEAGQEFRGRFSGALKGLAGLGVGIGAFNLFKTAITDASQAEQAIGGVQAVFGEYAGQVERESQDAATNLGLTATAYQELVTISGALLKNKGLTDFADQARTLVTVGADLAAQYGGSTTEAVEALNAALRGESDPIERYAISLNETAVNARLAAQGQDKLTGAALEQAKTQARLAIIQEQSADAQGAFGRESDTAAGQAARFSAEIGDLRAEFGRELLPALTETVSVMRTQVVPVVGDGVAAFGSMLDVLTDVPAPVYAAAGAFVALKVASSVGVFDAARRGIQGVTSATESLRLRSMLAADAYREARGGTLQLTGAYGQLTPAAGRLASAQRSLRTATAGVGASLSRGLGGAIGLLGGPWGAALTGGAALLATYYTQQREAALAVEGFTATLDEQTGALTANSREWAAKQLQDNGALEAARQLGIDLSLVTDAALNSEDAVAELRDAIWAARDAGQGGLATDLAGGFEEVRGTVKEGTAEFQLMSDAVGEAAGETNTLGDETSQTAGIIDGATGSAERYGTQLDRNVRSLKQLYRAEQDRRLAALQQRQDQLALIETLQAAQAEARRGKQTLDANTKAGQANLGALYDLAQQWNSSDGDVRKAEGAYVRMRREFIRVADEAGATKREAIKLADELLLVPRTAPITFQSKGYQERMEEIRRLKEAAAELQRMLDYQTLVKAAGDGSNPGRTTNYNINVDKVVADDAEGIGNKSRSRAGGGL